MFSYIVSEVLADWYDYLDSVYYRSPYHPYLTIALDLLKVTGIALLAYVFMFLFLL